MKTKLLFSILSRANFSRVKTVIKEAINNPNFVPIVVVGCSAICDDYGNIIEECNLEGIEINEKLSILMHEKSKLNMVRTTALGMIAFSSILEKYKPDIALTVADRYETLGFAVSCSYMQIPLIHLQGGEPTGCIDDKVRNAIAQLADYHFVCNNYAYDLTLKWGEDKKRVFNVGCPSLDHLIKIDKKNIYNEISYLNKKYDINLKQNNKYFVLLFHPDTRKNNQDYEIVIGSIIKFVLEKNINLIILNPNPDAGSTQIKNEINKVKSKIRQKESLENIFVLDNLISKDYIKLIQGCEILIGNSSSGIRESSYLGIKSLNIGNRQQFRFKGENVTDVEINSSEILKKLNSVLLAPRPTPNFIYGNGNSAKKIIDIIKNLNFSIKPTKV